MWSLQFATESTPAISLMAGAGGDGGMSSVASASVALVAALIGGAFAFFGSVYSTNRLLRSQTDVLAAENAEQRRLARRAIAESASFALVEGLAEIEAVLPDLHLVANYRLGFQGVDPGPRTSRAQHALAEAVRLDRTAARMLAPEGIAKRWTSLVSVVHELARYSILKDGEESATGWDPVKASRAQADAEQYLRYVWRSVLAVINDESLPPEASHVPYLNREDGAVWQAPDGLTNVLPDQG